MPPAPIQTLGINSRLSQTIDHEIHRTIETETIPTTGIGAIQIVEITVIRTIDQEIVHTTDQIIKDPITITIKIDHETIHKIGIQTIAINKEIILNLLIGIILVIPNPKTSMKATPKHQRQINQVQTTEEST